MPPPELQTTMIVSSISQYLAGGGSSVSSTLPGQVVSWVKAYPSNTPGVQSEIVSYLETNGNKKLLDKSGKLNDSGQQVITSIIAIIENPPVKKSGGNSDYISGLGKKPENWPDASASVKF